ncbi:MAG: sigma 54-interacting transcriptional regulator, partial [Clostridiales bacterium]|nr:sigma 54-interacting transcriptional regulator [Clostridiales bacterium]
MKGIFSKENIEKILDYVSDAVQIIDNKGKIIYCNRASAKLDGVEQNAILGKHVLEIYPSLDEDTSTLLRVIKTGKKIVNLQQSFINYKGESITTINSSFPIKEGEKVVGAIEISSNITQMKKLTEKVVDLQTQLYNSKMGKRKQARGTAKYTFSDIIGNSKVMRQIKERAIKASENSSSVIIYGDTGTGKELIVQAIHNYSSRFAKPFIVQNCAAIPNTLLESILFGTVKGSFTGAEDRKGLFELANGGTLFLDEINSMPITLQAKLLRVLEDGFIRRVGDVKTYDIDVRIITAMNMNPKVAVENKLLRKDLYYRLNVLSIRVPDLVERRE